MDTNINIRKIELKDYKYINKWWVEQGFIALDKSILPMNGLGGIIIEKNKPIAVGYLYLTNSKKSSPISLLYVLAACFLLV